MKESFANAKLFKRDVIRLFVFTTTPRDKSNIILLIDDEKKIILNETKQTSMQYMYFFEFKLKENLELGHKYNIVIPHFGMVPLDVSDITQLDGFDDEFYYAGNDLGVTYHESFSEFVLWAPLASSVYLKITKEEKVYYHLLTREEKGIYRLKLDGDYKNSRYTYFVCNNGNTVEVSDPYAKGSTQNGKESVVVDFDSLKINMNEDKLPLFQKYTDAIIYEGHVRDLTIDPNTNIVNKGRFKGLVEENRTTKNGFPVGRDYIKNLGVTHLQLLPIYDYKTVDETNPSASYNWGYDPSQYFAVEGSYASDLTDPLSRIKDLKELVSEYHKDGVRIIMDVVFNHVYESEFSVFEKIVPNYYFRIKNNGKLSNVSGCGNDVHTQRKMIRKLIVDACVFFVETYSIDGFRFDLMGMIDIETIKEVYTKCKALKKDFMMYGEGWNMSGEISPNLLANMESYEQIPNIGFFNDTFRDVVKGPSFKDRLLDWGYGLGSTSLNQIFKFVFVGSSFDFIYPKKFLSPNQTINYVECHDNGTLFDKIDAARSDLTLDTKLQIVRLINAIVGFAIGVPFYHAGQEIGMSKKGHDNTYNSGDELNYFNYELAEERKSMVSFFKQLIRLRKFAKLLRDDTLGVIDTNIDIEDLNGGGILFKYKAIRDDVNLEKIFLFINPTSETVYYDLDDYYLNFFNENGLIYETNTYTKNIMISPFSLFAVVK